MPHVAHTFARSRLIRGQDRASNRLGQGRSPSLIVLGTRVELAFPAQLRSGAFAPLLIALSSYC
jgi:hypothetical protein